MRHDTVRAPASHRTLYWITDVMPFRIRCDRIQYETDVAYVLASGVGIYKDTEWHTHDPVQAIVLLRLRLISQARACLEVAACQEIELEQFSDSVREHSVAKAWDALLFKRMAEAYAALAHVGESLDDTWREIVNK